LPEDDRTWLDFVAPIIFLDEKKAFLELVQPYERETFREEFWKRRERDGLRPPLGPGYRARYAELRQLADSQYDRWPNEAARMVIRYGEPASIDKLESCSTSATATFRDLEIWTYASAGSLGNRGRRCFFYRRSMMEPRRLWTVGTPDRDVFAITSCRKSFPELGIDCRKPYGDACSETTCFENCEVFKVWNEISTLQGSALGGQMEAVQLLEPEKVSLEGMDAIKNRSASSSEPKARVIGVVGPSGTVEAAKNPDLLAGKSPPPEDDRKWLEFVAPIIFPEEKKLFLELREPRQRETFREEFWKRREQPGLPTPLGLGYRGRYEQFVQLAATTYGGVASDAGRMVVHYGEPQNLREFLACNAVFRDLELWSYSDTAGAARKERRYLFYRAGIGGLRSLWTPSQPDAVLIQPSACLKGIAEVCLEASGPPPASPGDDPACRQASPKSCADGCEVARIVEQIRAERAGYPDQAQLFAPPPIPAEGWDRMRAAFTTVSDPRARPLTVEGPSAPGVVGASTKAQEEPSQKERLASLPEDDRTWLDFVAPIIFLDEKKAFLELVQPY
ncbi:MAG: GWxTD domain-containing protein, partial [Thermoanaerobaculia bacterium]